MVSAVMARLVIPMFLAGLAIVVSRFRQFRLCPVGKDGEEAGDVFDDLPGVLAAEIAIEMRLPRLDGAVDQIVVCCVRWFH